MACSEQEDADQTQTSLATQSLKMSTYQTYQTYSWVKDAMGKRERGTHKQAVLPTRDQT